MIKTRNDSGSEDHGIAPQWRTFLNLLKRADEHRCTDCSTSSLLWWRICDVNRAAHKVPVYDPKVISRMRQERRFPINEKVIGKKIVYTLDAVANSLLDDVPETVPQQTPVKTKVTPVKRRAIYKQAPIQDLSQKMLRMAFVSNFKNQIKAMEEVAIFFRGKMASDELGVILPTRDNGQILRPDKP